MSECSTPESSALRGRLLLVGTKEKPTGAPMALLRLAAGLSERGWAVDARFLYREAAISAPDYRSSCLLEQPPRGWRDHLAIIKALASLIRRSRPDAIITFLPYAGSVACTFGRFYGVRSRVSSHRVPRTTYGLGMRWADLAAAWTGSYTDIVAVSRGIAAFCDAYPKRLRENIHVVYNGLRGWPQAVRTKAATRANLGVPNEAQLIVSVGRLDAQKNHQLLIEAFVETKTDSYLVIAGEGELRAKLSARITELGLTSRIRLLGALPRQEIAELLEAADLFALASLFEGQSNALLEALNAGLPCLVSDVPEQVETVSVAGGEIAGAVLPLNNPSRWAKTIDEFANSEEKAQSARALAQRVSRQFTFDQMIDGFDHVVRDRLLPSSVTHR